MAGFDLEELEMAGELVLKEQEENKDEDEETDDDDESESSEDESAEPSVKSGVVETKEEQEAERELVINLETLRLTNKPDSPAASNKNAKPKIVELN